MRAKNTLVHYIMEWTIDILFLASVHLTVTFWSNSPLFLRLQEWYDEFLTWDPADYDGLNYTVMRADDLWLPDIYIQNRSVQ